MSEAFAELFEKDKNSLQIEQGTLIEGTISQITDSIVTVDAGLKSEGVIPVEEFFDKNSDLNVEVGDKVEVVLEVLEDGFGKTRMSRLHARQRKIWKNLEEAYEKKITVTGMLINRVKGGFTIDIEGVNAFLPGSLTDIKPIRDKSYTHLENKEIEFKVVKLDQARNNIVVSRKAVLEEKYGTSLQDMEKDIREGEVVKGIVKHLTDYGAFIGINGFDGLLHITDMAWRRVRNPSEILSVDDEVEVKILKHDKEKNRISLGLKQLTEDPWIQLVERYPVGTQVSGTVTSLTDYGCFVEIEESVEGLVHVSEMDWTNKNITPSKVVAVGDKVEVMVISVDKSKRRISLGIKQCLSNPWEEFKNNNPKGTKFKGIVKSINDFGIFVETPVGKIDGLVHISDISTTESSEKAILKYKKGDEVEVVVLFTDVERERIALSLKALQDDFLQDYMNDHPKGTVVESTVDEITDKQVFVKLTEKVKGAISLSEFQSGDDKPQISVGDKVEAKVMSNDKKYFVIRLSVKDKEREEQAEAVKEYSAKKESSFASLGDFIKDIINPLKKK